MSNFYADGKAGLTSNEDTWTTPKDLFAALDQEFNFGLDAAALSSSALCHKWFGPDHPDLGKRDALICDWAAESNYEPIFVNPPYGRGIKKWVMKAHEEALKGVPVVALVPARTDTNWFQDFCMVHEVRYIRGRLNFSESRKFSAPFPSAIIVMGVSPIDICVNCGNDDGIQSVCMDCLELIGCECKGK